MENKIYDTVQKYKMLEKGDNVIVGFSGGADSCTLFYTLLALKKKLDIKIYACHINHMLRGAEADRDENFVTELCRQYDIELYKLRINVREEAVKRKMGTEQCGREIRYEFFQQTAEKLHAKIATAHTASDNAETVLFHLARGCGTRGLCGIPPVRENIIRPLIEVTREEIENYCEQNKIEYITDSTNSERNYTRNKIRLDVIPVFKEMNLHFENHIFRMSETLRNNVSCISALAQDALNLARTENGYQNKILLNLSDTVLSECIYLLLSEYNMIPDFSHIALIKKIMYNSGAVELKCHIFAVSKQGFLRIIKTVPQEKSLPVFYQGQESIIINHKKISFLKINIDEFNKRKKNDKFLFHISLDYDTIPLSGYFRNRQAGDCFQLPRRKITKTLKKLFCELKIPAEIRDGLIVFADGNDVIWAEKIGASEKFQVTSETKNILLIHIENTKEQVGTL